MIFIGNVIKIQKRYKWVVAVAGLAYCAINLFLEWKKRKMEKIEKALSGKESFLKLLMFTTVDSSECKQMSDVINDLMKTDDYSEVLVLRFDTSNPESETAVEKFKVTSVPCFVFYFADEELDRIVGADVPNFIKKLKSCVDKVRSSSIASEAKLKADIRSLINKAPCMLFMKGCPEAPRCGFSKETIAILTKHNVEYETFDILQDNKIREGLKAYSNWPTYPQLYIKGELIGGCDILKELSASRELDEIAPKRLTEDLRKKLHDLINQSSVMVFMKGTPEEPRCGFSNTLVKIFCEIKIKYGSFNILADNEVREGLKKYSNWPTYPQVYAKGQLIGGLDIIKELHESGDLEEALNEE